MWLPGDALKISARPLPVPRHSYPGDRTVPSGHPALFRHSRHINGVPAPLRVDVTSPDCGVTFRSVEHPLSTAV